MPCAHPYLLHPLHQGWVFARPSSSQCCLVKPTVENTAIFVVRHSGELDQCHMRWMPRQVEKFMDKSWGREISLLGKWSRDQLSHFTEGCPWTVNAFEGFFSCTCSCWALPKGTLDI